MSAVSSQYPPLPCPSSARAPAQDTSLDYRGSAPGRRPSVDARDLEVAPSAARKRKSPDCPVGRLLAEPSVRHRHKERHYTHPGEFPMRLCDTTLMSTVERAAFPDWMVGVMQELQQQAADVRLLGRPYHRLSRAERRDDTQLFDVLTHARVQAVSNALMVCAWHDLWGFGFDPVSHLPIPPSNAVAMVTVMRLLHGGDPFRDAPEELRKRKKPDPVQPWLYPGAAPAARAPVVGDLLQPAAECVLWTDMVGRSSMYRPIRVAAVEYHPGIGSSSFYHAEFVFLDEWAVLGQQVVDLHPSEIDTDDARVLTSPAALESCWREVYRHQFDDVPYSPSLSLCSFFGSPTASDNTVCDSVVSSVSLPAELSTDSEWAELSTASEWGTFDAFPSPLPGMTDLFPGDDWLTSPPPPFRPVRPAVMFLLKHHHCSQAVRESRHPSCSDCWRNLRLRRRLVIIRRLLPRPRRPHLRLLSL